MINLDPKTFFDGYRESFDVLNQARVDGLNSLLVSFGADPDITDKRFMAYMLATVKRECGNQWMPIEEYGKGAGKLYGTADPETGQAYYGRGFVQLTWKRNYQTFANLLGQDLVNHPELALQPDLAYQIMSAGMRKGLFTGVGLPSYIYGGHCDYFNARKIINALDHASQIADWAMKFEAIIQAAAAAALPAAEPTTYVPPEVAA